MSGRKVATTVYITEDQDRRLKLLSQATNVSMAQYIREGIELILERHAEQVPRQLGLALGDDELTP
jgi:predicted DNA-binding protein